MYAKIQYFKLRAKIQKKQKNTGFVVTQIMLRQVCIPQVKKFGQSVTEKNAFSCAKTQFSENSFKV